MLRMIIADDERMIRESMASIINWKSLGVELAGLCPDGISAYDKILDEYPDIVLTDIRMPGLTGLELIEKVQSAGMNIEFIILSGFDEFEYARTAMRFGVKHYLLKPCNEKDIMETIESCKKSCKEKKSVRFNQLLESVFSDEEYVEEPFAQLSLMLSDCKDMDTLRDYMFRLLPATQKSNIHTLSAAKMAETIEQINGAGDLMSLLFVANELLAYLFNEGDRYKATDPVNKIKEYVFEHLSDSNLNLKWMAENVLYMNVDYISRQFVKRTGTKFSTYLSEKRIDLAKELFVRRPDMSTAEIAEQVGFGNNPQYFNQIFKKYVGQTTSAYRKGITT